MTDAPTGTSDAAARCPSCGALRPPAVSWCLQCYAPFDPPQPALGPSEPLEALDEHDLADDDLPDDDLPDDEDVVRTDGPTAADPDEVAARAEEMLRRLSAEGSGRDVGRFGHLVSGRGARMGLAVAGAVLLTLVLFGLMAAVGALL